MDIDPLRKRKTSGELYTRRSPTIVFIKKSLHWSFDDRLDRALIPDRRRSEYVPSEVLVYYLRQTKSGNTDGRFIRLYEILHDRVETACPRANRHVGEKIHEDSRLSEIRDSATAHLPTTERMDSSVPRKDHDVVQGANRQLSPDQRPSTFLHMTSYPARMGPTRRLPCYRSP